SIRASRSPGHDPWQGHVRERLASWRCGRYLPGLLPVCRSERAPRPSAITPPRSQYQRNDAGSEVCGGATTMTANTAEKGTPTGQSSRHRTRAWEREGTKSLIGSMIVRKLSIVWLRYIVYRGNMVRYLRHIGVRIGSSSSILNGVLDYGSEPWL